MAQSLADFLTYVKVKRPVEVSINHTKFFPSVRGVEYKLIRSGGLRTLTCIGYFVALLEASLSRPMNHPGLLMIDTVGKYLGKTKEKYAAETSALDDQAEGASDPGKYKAIFTYFVELEKTFEMKERSFQAILVDNDIPAEIAESLRPFVAVHYSSIGENGLPVGFIDDAVR